MVITDRLKSFAQGLLIEAVDASYAIGFVEIIYRTFFLKPPQPKIKKILTKLSRKALMHWFKHVKATDLTTVKIYDCVRKTIAIKFRQYFINIANDLVMNKSAVAVLLKHGADVLIAVDYSTVFSKKEKSKIFGMTPLGLAKFALKKDRIDRGQIIILFLI